MAEILASRAPATVATVAVAVRLLRATAHRVAPRVVAATTARRAVEAGITVPRVVAGDTTVRQAVEEDIPVAEVVAATPVVAVVTEAIGKAASLYAMATRGLL